MKYGFRDDQLPKPRTFFPASAQVDNVILDKVEYLSGQGKDGNAYEAIEFTYKREDDAGNEQTITDRQFPVNEAMISPLPTQTPEEAIKQAYENFNGKLYRVAAACGMTKEEINESCGSASNFRELIESYAEVVNSRAKGQYFWLKTMKDAKGFTKVAMFTDFIQPMTDGECRLAYTPSEQRYMEKIASAPKPGVNDVTSQGAPDNSWSGATEEQF